MPNCKIHPEIHYPEGKSCILCLRELEKKNKTITKADWAKDLTAKKREAQGKYTRFNRYVKLKPDGKVNNDMENAKRNLQVNWRKIIYPYYLKKGLADFCWICKKPFLKGVSNKLYSAHVAHYYSKAHLYFLWIDPVNSGICCYRDNVDRPETVAAMEPMIIEAWGQQRFDDLRGRAEKYLDLINKGVDEKGFLVRKKPTLEWYKAEIIKTKNLIIQ